MRADRRASVRTAWPLGVLLLLAVPLAAEAAVTVPSPPFRTIQAAINAVVRGSLPNGTLINVLPGTYREALVVSSTGRSFTVRAVRGAALTRIDATGKGQSAITIRNASGVIRFEGFLVTGGLFRVGAGFYIQNSAPTFVSCIVQGNAATADGGGGALVGASPIFRSSIIRNNRAARFGGGLVMVLGSRPVFTSTRLENNESGRDSPVGSGGAVHANDSSPTFISSVIAGNRSKFAAGGIFVLGQFGSPRGPATLVMQDSTVANNITSRFNAASNPAEGGGIHIENNAIARLTRVAVRGNVANTGGGLNNHRGALEVTGSIIETNQALDPQGVTGFGGGLHGQIITLADTVIRNNVARLGGGILVAGQPSCGGGGTCGKLTITDALVLGNAASVQGGGIHVSRGTLSVLRTQVFRNRVAGAADALGGGILVNMASGTIADTAIVENTSTNLGGGVYLNEAPVNITRSVVYRNSAGARGGGLAVFAASALAGTVQTSILADNSHFQIHDGGCPPTAPLLTYLNNTITSPAADLYQPSCDPPIRSIAQFNALPRTEGNNSNVPRFVSFAAVPDLTPSVLSWSIGRARSITISGIGAVTAPTGTRDVSPRCTTAYVLKADTLTAPVTTTVRGRGC
ncbi:MAG TPA: hypothetical protein VGW35_15905 [Methylomirabilota bacterium]|nr:hypothetical protein [Methylomirabilota bacterium]